MPVRSYAQRKGTTLNFKGKMALKQMRTMAGWSQRDLADLMQCSQSLISKLEADDNGKVLTLDEIDSWADACGFDVEIMLRKKKG